jgi:hypothetical protein
VSAEPVRGAQPAPTTGVSTDDLLAVLIERAATHQLQAVEWLRLARNPARGAVPPSARRAMVLRGLGHIADARRLLGRASVETDHPELRTVIEQRLQQLDAVGARAEAMAHVLTERALDG